MKESTPITTQQVLKKFLKESIKLMDRTIKRVNKKYPDLFK